MTGCTISTQGSDFVGDPKLGTFTDQIKAADGSLQGNGQIPLLAGSPAIDGGDYTPAQRRTSSVIRAWTQTSTAVRPVTSAPSSTRRS
jgi:hypothetical protein